MSKESLKLLSELGEYSDAHLRWNVTFPDYVPIDRIGVNVDRINYLSHLGGLNHLLIDSRSGDTSSEQPEITGIDGQGNATAGMRLTKTKVDMSSAGVEKQKASRDNVYSEYFWGQGHISINSNELNKRVLDASRPEKAPSIRQPQVWANLLDKSLTKGITENAKQQLLGNVSGLSQFMLGIAIGDVVAPPTSYSVGHLAEAFLKFSGESIIITSIVAYATGGHTLKERRLSLIPAYQLDRLFMVNAIARTTKLAKVIK